MSLREVPSGLYCVGHDQRSRHRAYSTRDRSDQARLLFYTLVVDITRYSIFPYIYANIDYYCAFLDHISGDELWPAHRDTDDVRSGHYLVQTLPFILA